jgi:hypothetical protein
MSDWLVHLVQVGKFGKHPNADTLSITQVYGQNVIFRTGGFQEGDLAVFLPPDSVLPTDPEHPLLKDNPGLKPGHRVDAVRLRGIFSNGFMVPAKILFTEEELKDIPVGTHVADRIGVTKYEDEGEKLSTRGDNERDPGYMPCYTDIEGWPKHRHVIPEGEEVVITEKIHGCVDADTILETLERGPLAIREIVQNRLEVHVKSARLTSRPIQLGNCHKSEVVGDFCEYKKVIDWSELSESDDWYEIELPNGKLLHATGNHEVWLPVLRCWRRVDQLTENDQILID